MQAYMADIFRKLGQAGELDMSSLEKRARINAAALELSEQVDASTLSVFETCSVQQLTNFYHDVNNSSFGELRSTIDCLSELVCDVTLHDMGKVYQIFPS